MASHILQLEVKDIQNAGVFLIDDLSIYTNTLPVVCPSLQITPPGYSTPTVMTPVPGFRLILNACMLGLIPPAGCSQMCPNIPDGIYGIAYSVSPNDKVFVEYQYLRIVSAVNRLNEMLCALGLPCCLPDDELEYELNNINIIRNYLISAQTNVNIQHNFQDGMNQYRYAVVLMDKMTTRKPNCFNYNNYQ